MRTVLQVLRHQHLAVRYANKTEISIDTRERGRCPRKKYPRHPLHRVPLVLSSLTCSRLLYSVFTLMMICGRASFETRHGPFFGVVLDLKRTKCPRRYTSRKQRPPSEQAGSPSGILEAILSIKLYTKLRYLPTVYTSLRYTSSHQSILTALFTTVFSSAWYIREAYITTLRPTDQVSCYLSSESHWLWL